MPTVNTEKLDALLRAKADLKEAKAAKEAAAAGYVAALDNAALAYNQITT